jgi:hypothetical protein
VTNPPTPAERLASLLLALIHILDRHCRNGLLAGPRFFLIFARLKTIKYTFARLAARIQAGRAFPRRPTAPRKPAEQKHPRTKNPLPQGVAWLLKLVPETAASASQLRLLLADPEMVALLAAAPAPLRTPIRSLCRMLGLDPPAILALPPDTRPKRPPKERKPRPRREKPEKIRYVFGIRYPSIFPNPR